MTKYKLLRDLPGYKAGTVFAPHDAQGGTIWTTTDDMGNPLGDTMHNYLTLAQANVYPDWFQPLPEDTGGQTRYWSVWFQPDGDDRAALYSEKLTEAQVEAITDVLNGTLAYIQTPGLWDEDQRTNLGNLLERARVVVQKGKA